MGLETASYIGDLNAANPAGADPKSQGDDHIRLLKAAARNSFPGFAGVVAGTGVESGSGNAYVVALSPATSAYAAGMLVVFKAVHANTGAATLQVNALSPKALKAVDGSALESGDIEAGAVVGAFYDGTDFFMISGVDRAARGGDSYSGTHDFTGAAVQVATAGAADNSTKAASTAYVDAADMLKADLASPTLTGVPTAPTAALGTNTSQLATTAFATQLAFQAALPVQTGAAVLYTDGTAASWRASFVGDSGSGGQLGPVPAPALGDGNKFLKGNGTWARPPLLPDVIVSYELPSGSSSAIYAGGAWRTNILNTVNRNDGSVGSLISNQLTLPPGVWLLRARASAGVEGVVTGARLRARLYNATTGTVISQGTQCRVTNVSGEPTESLMEVVGVVALASASAIELQLRASVNFGNGRACSFGDNEVYSFVEATLVSV